MSQRFPVRHRWPVHRKLPKECWGLGYMTRLASSDLCTLAEFFLISRTIFLISVRFVRIIRVTCHTCHLSFSHHPWDPLFVDSTLCVIQTYYLYRIVVLSPTVCICLSPIDSMSIICLFSVCSTNNHERTSPYYRINNA